MKRILKYILLTISLLMLWAVIIFFGTQNGWWHQPIAEQGDSEEYINAVKEKISQQYVGNFALALVKDGDVEDEIFHSEGKPVDRNTVFQVASLSKWISAFGVMVLVEEGKLDLDVPVSKYLNSLAITCESEFNNDGVTVRRLLSHTAGLTDGLGYSGFEPGAPAQPIEESLTKASDADEGISGAVQVGIEPGCRV